MIIGVNQAWFAPPSGVSSTINFGNDINRADFERSVVDAFDKLQLTGSSVIGIWAFEGNHPEGVSPLQNNRPSESLRVNPTILSNLRRIMQLALRRRIKIKWTLIAPMTGDGPIQSIYSEILSNLNVAQLFYNNTIRPFLNIIVTTTPSGNLIGSLFYIDLVNEINFCVNKGYCNWNQACAWMNSIASWIHRDFNNLITITVSVAFHFPTSLISRWTSLEEQQNCLRFLNNARTIGLLDIHIYNDTGEVPNSTQLLRDGRLSKAVVLGEFGQKDSDVDDNLQTTVIQNFLNNSLRQRYYAVIGWRLITHFQQHDINHGYFVNIANPLNYSARPVVGTMRNWISNNP